MSDAGVGSFDEATVEMRTWWARSFRAATGCDTERHR